MADSAYEEQRPGTQNTHPLLLPLRVNRRVSLCEPPLSPQNETTRADLGPLETSRQVFPVACKAASQSMIAPSSGLLGAGKPGWAWEEQVEVTQTLERDKDPASVGQVSH